MTSITDRSRIQGQDLFHTVNMKLLLLSITVTSMCSKCMSPFVLCSVLSLCNCSLCAGTISTQSLSHTKITLYLGQHEECYSLGHKTFKSKWKQENRCVAYWTIGTNKKSRKSKQPPSALIVRYTFTTVYNSPKWTGKHLFNNVMCHLKICLGAFALV